MNDYAISFDAIVSTTYFQRAGPQEDPGLEIISQVEFFKLSDMQYRREVIRAVLGDAAHIRLPCGVEVPQFKLNPANEQYLYQLSVGSMARLTPDGKVDLVCIAPLDVEDEVAPNDKHYIQVFSSEHRVLFTYDGKSLSGKLLDGQVVSDPKYLMDPRKWDLSTGKPYQGLVIDEVFNAGVHTIYLDDLAARFPGIEVIEF